MNVKSVSAVILTVRVSQPQEKHFHTAERGMERHGHSSAGPPCTLSPEAKAPPPPSTDLHTPTMSARGTKVTHLTTMKRKTYQQFENRQLERSGLKDEYTPNNNLTKLQPFHRKH